MLKLYGSFFSLPGTAPGRQSTGGKGGAHPSLPARGRVAEAADGRDARAAVDPCLASRGRLARRLPIPSRRVAACQRMLSPHIECAGVPTHMRSRAH